MAKVPMYLKSGQNRSDVNALIVEMDHCADAAEHHVAFQGELPEYVTKSDKLRQFSGGLG
jgi:hypothetical protein